jgi:hypothetical protein
LEFLHDLDVVADVEAHVLAEEGLGDGLKLSQVIDDLLEDDDFDESDALLLQNSLVVFRVLLHLLAGPPVDHDPLMVLVNQSCLLLEISLLIGGFEDFRLPPGSILNEEIVVSIVVQFLSHIVDQIQRMKRIQQVLILLLIELSLYLVHDDLCLTVEGVLVLDLLAAALLSELQPPVLELVLVLGVVGVEREEDLEVIVCHHFLELRLLLELLQVEARDEDV